MKFRSMPSLKAPTSRLGSPKLALIFATAVTSLLSGPQALAQTRVWQTGGNSNWANGGNWVGGVAPTAGNIVSLGGAQTVNSVNNLTADISIGGLLFTNSHLTFTNAFTVTNSRLTLGGDITTTASSTAITDTMTIDMILSATRTVTTGTGHNLTLSGLLSGSTFGITKAGGGLLTLSGATANSYSGLTTVNDGTLELNKSSGNAIANGGLTINTGATVQYNASAGTDQIGNQAVITLAGGTFNMNNKADIVGRLVYNSGTISNVAGPLVLAGGSLDVLSMRDTTIGFAVNINSNGATGVGVTFDATNNGTATINGDINININATAGSFRPFTVNDGSAATDMIINGVIKDTVSGGLTKAGAGTLTLTNTNTYRGGTTLSAGTLTMGNANALGSTSGPLTVNGGTLNMADNSLTVGNFTGSGGTISGTSGARTLTIGQGDATGGNYQGVIENGAGGTTALTKIGTGTLTLSGSVSNTYTGLTTVSAGTLELNKSGGSNAIANGGLTINTGGTVQYNASAGTSQIGNQSTVTVAGGTFNMNSKADVLGKLIYNSGTISNVAGPLLLAGAALDVLSMRDTTIGFAVNINSNATSGVGVTFDATNNGTATINGDIDINISAPAGTSRTFTINNGTAASDMIINGVIKNTVSGGLIKAGAGTLALTNTNTYGGATAVDTGTLALTGSGSISSSSNYIVNGTLDVSAITPGTFAVATGKTLSGSGTVNATGKTLSIEGRHAVGNSNIGQQDLTGTVSYAAGSIFEWQLGSNVESGRGTNFDAADVAGTLAVDSGAVFKIILGTNFDGGNSFWLANRAWDVLTATTSSTAFTNFELYNSGDLVNQVSYNTFGTFSYGFTGGTGTLNWTAVPEPTSAIAGLLLTAGFLRRRRK